jgi:hypothetical protein
MSLFMKITKKIKIALTCVFILTFLPCLSIAAPEKRTALVIGNSDYEIGSLTNPVNDAVDMASTLKRLGFEVILKKNIRHRDMEEAIEDFGNRLKRGGVGLFYYAGHGIQINGVNYIIPIGAKIKKESDVKFEAVDANRILDEMGNANNGLNIIILDACRDNPLARNFRSSNRGLAVISSAPEGSFISYATGPGQVAMDGEKRNSPYTAALLKYMNVPGLPIERVFKNVRISLESLKQTPWELSSLKGEFFFTPGLQKVPLEQSVTSPASTISSGQDINVTRQPVKVQENSTETADSIDLSGTWRAEHVSGQIYIYNDGKCIYKGFLIVTVGGKWSRPDPQKRVFSIAWNHGFTDVMTLSADGQRLVGVNNLGDPVSFVRNK